MPQRVRFVLEGEAPLDAFRHGSGLRAVALSWIQAADPAASEALHASGAPKPYTIGPLLPVAGEPSLAAFEMTFLSEALWERVVEGLDRRGPTARLGAACYRLCGEPALVEACAWGELLRTAGPHRPSWPLRLLTPTAHHIGGGARKSVVLPDPFYYFGSWLSRWNLWGPQELDGSLLEVVAGQVAVSSCGGRTEAVPLDRGRTFLGFVGEVTFSLLAPQSAPQGTVEALTALARLGSFCGTGVETMRGMGQTRLLRAAG